jgi:hypothetical protein
MIKTNLEYFNNPSNISLLWDVLMDKYNNIKNNQSISDNIKLIFDTNIGLFLSKVNGNLSIIDLNKQFLSQVVLAVNKLMPNINNINEKNKKIVITEEEISLPYKVEDIHESRKSEFEKSIEKRKQEFELLLNPPAPKNINLGDSMNYTYEPIDLLVSELKKEREYSSVGQNSSVGHNSSVEKKVTWTDDTSFLTKLKTVPVISSNDFPVTNIINTNSSKDINNHPYDFSKYVEQPSITLDQAKTISNTISTEKLVPKENIIYQNTPMLTNTELIKQFQIINEKIDNLYQLFHSFSNPSTNLSSTNPLSTNLSSTNPSSTNSNS